MTSTTRIDPQIGAKYNGAAFAKASKPILMVSSYFLKKKKAVNGYVRGVVNNFYIENLFKITSEKQYVNQTYLQPIR